MSSLVNIIRNVLLLSSMSLLVLCKIFAASGTKIVLFYLKILFDLLINFKSLLLVWKNYCSVTISTRRNVWAMKLIFFSFSENCSETSPGLSSRKVGLRSKHWKQGAGQKGTWLSACLFLSPKLRYI